VAVIQEMHTMAAATFEAVVTDIRLESRVGGQARWQIALDRTLFSATRTAGVLVAVARSGARLEVPVLGVVEEDGVVWHLVDKPLMEETVVTGRVVS
jgi:alanyl-tRNA synthetase